MKTRGLLLWLVLTLLAHEDADGKRFDPSMVDPLMRRSPLEKNFMRFGRSSPSLNEEDYSEVTQGSSGAETSKEENFLRSMRGKQDNFMRFGRRNDNFMRFGRGKQDNFMRFGKSGSDNFMRFGKSKQDNFMRFGRAKQDNFMRFGRGKQNNFMRFGRGKQDNFMRFGRGKQDNFMRFGRGKQDNFMRFGKAYDGTLGTLPNFEPTLAHESMDKQNGIEFRKPFDDSDENEIKIAMRADPKNNMNFMRFGRAKQDNFMRFGKSVEDLEDSKETSSDDFMRDIKSKDLNLVRLGRQPSNKENGFIRFGRISEDHSENTPLTLIPPRLKRSAIGFFENPGEFYPRKFKDDSENLEPILSLPEGLDEEYVSEDHSDDFNSRKKRSLSYKSPTIHPPVESNPADYISSKYVLDTIPKTEFQTSLISAGLPNVIVGPEFSLLPDLDPPSSMKKHRPGDQSFLRLG